MRFKQSESTACGARVGSATLTTHSAEILISPRSVVATIEDLPRAKVGILQSNSLSRFHAQRAALLEVSGIDIVESQTQVS
jgi:hypothetical protein